jgi:hypothetical protein
MVLLVALHHPPVGQRDLRRDQLVRRKSPAATQQAEPAAEHLAADADRGAAAGRERDVVPGEGGVEVSEPAARSHGGQPVRDPHGTHQPQVQDHPAAGRAAGEVVPSTPHRHVETRATGERDRLDHVIGRPAQHHRLRAHIVEASDLRPANLVIARGAGKYDLALQGRGEVLPGGLDGGHVRPLPKRARADVQGEPGRRRPRAIGAV